MVKAMNAMYEPIDLMIKTIRELTAIFSEEGVLDYLSATNDQRNLKKKELFAVINEQFDALNTMESISLIDSHSKNKLLDEIKKLEFKLKVSNDINHINVNLINSIVKIKYGLSNLQRYDQKGKNKTNKIRSGSIVMSESV
jgi:hypothetical protein